MGRSASRKAVGVPLETSSFVGRRQAIAEAKRLLSAGRLVTLIGVSGVGKTRLAMRLAELFSRAFPDGVWLVSLAMLEDEALVPHAVADVLGIHDETDRDPVTVVVDYLRDRRVLLVLDNCEHLLDACAQLVSAILPNAVGVRVLATSRHRLGLIAERLLDVSPLPVPAPGEPSRAAEAFPAMQLFVDRAAAADPGFEVTTGNWEAVARLCRRLDGLPLAIELAAVRTPALGVEQLVERLDDRYRLLTGGSLTGLPHHQTLRAAVDWSYALCTPAEQLTWALLSVFSGSFDLRAAEAVCAGEDVGPGVLDTVAGLVDKSVLVHQHDDSTTVRYRLLSSLQDYGLAKLAEFGKAITARRRHRDYYLRLASEYEAQWFGARQPAIMAHLRAEHDNIRVAFDFCLTMPTEARLGLRLVGSLWFYWICQGASAEARNWLRKLAGHHGCDQLGPRSKALWTFGEMILIHSRSAVVLLAEDPARRKRTAPDPPAPPAAPPLAGAIPERSDLMSVAIISRVDLACTLTFRGLPEQAVPLCVEALAVCLEAGEQWARSYVLRTLAAAGWATQDYAGAAAHARDCLRLDHAVLGPQGIGRTLDLLAAIAAGAGAAERSGVLLGASEKIWPDTSRGPAESRRQTGRIRASEAQARQLLGDRGFERAFQRGSRLSLADVVAYALADRAGPPKPTERTESTVSSHGPSGTGLTARQLQVAELVAGGLTDKQIAETLVIAPRTAETHVENILRKLSLTKRTQLAAWFSAQHRNK